MLGAKDEKWLKYKLAILITGEKAKELVHSGEYTTGTPFQPKYIKIKKRVTKKWNNHGGFFSEKILEIVNA